MNLKIKHRTRYLSAHKHTPTKIDFPIFILGVLLLVIGVLMVFNASVVEAYRQFGNQFYFAQRQLVWAGIGFIGMLAIIHIPIELVKKHALSVFIFCLVLLLLVLIPGFGKRVGGATRWLTLGPISLQPAEVAKLSVVIYFSALFEKVPKLKPMLWSLIIIGGLIMLQPDLGSTLLIAGLGIGLYFAAGGSIKNIFLVVLTGLALSSALIFSSDYRRERVFTFLNPEADPLGASFQVRQINISLGSGGWFGTGIGRSLQKYSYIPEATTDSIFAIIAEETGFIGSSLVLGLYIALAYRGFSIAKRLDDNFMRLIAVGATLMIATQTILNLSAIVGIIPFTGETLPLISYGRSSLLVSLAAIGLLLNVSKYASANKTHLKTRIRY